MAIISKKAAVIFILLIYAESDFAKPRPQPYDNSLNPDMVKECESNRKVEAICQLCAKRTKSVIVYPMCCSNEEDVYTWCLNYLNFGLYTS
ncbi:uncharacterized protein LOC108745184 [Agrilus planipennis]|uniref:Uncharacterized protein LOC108745184 n=1 Tax=Agrilus planipennis TaxID=224129 RepID=A0A1W4XLF2_AGRPL|nr:uncharacterized protein LOC108745184 [Agrilus planipennis]